MGMYGFGVDVGGTSVKIGFFTADGLLIDKWEIPTDTKDGGINILPDISVSILSYLAQKGVSSEDVAGIGIGVPGPVTEKSFVSKCVNLGWKDKDVAKELSDLSGFKVVVGNDANVAALGEMAAGAAKGYKSAIVVTLGTGVGGGIIVDGLVVEGANGAGGEIGHFVVNRKEQESCNCGQHGCLEQYVSATGIVRLARKALTQNSENTILKNDVKLSAKMIFDAAKEGDTMALTIVDEVCQILGKTLANMSAIINPEVIVIGGGVSKAGELLLSSVRKHFYEDCFFPCVYTNIELATLGNDAGIFGGNSLIK